VASSALGRDAQVSTGPACEDNQCRLSGPARRQENRRKEVCIVPSTEEILDNVVWLVNALDDEALAEVQDIPFLEMAKVITIAPLPAGFAPSSRALRERLGPRSPAIRSDEH
jgi:hypothetical protein